VQATRAVRVWNAVSIPNMQILLQAADEAQCEAPGARTDNVSIMYGPGFKDEKEDPLLHYVHYVYWVHKATLEGRYVGLDDDNKVVYSTDMNHKKHDFTRHACVKPNCGVEMAKLVRLVMPNNMLTLTKMWNQILVTDVAGIDAPASGICNLCSTVREDRLSTCAICLLTWHNACGSALCAARNTNIVYAFPAGFPKPRTLYSAFWKKRKPHAVCALCEHVLSHADK